MTQRFYYCPKCGGKLGYQPYQGVSRLTCPDCAYIFFENPVVGVAAAEKRKEEREAEKKF